MAFSQLILSSLLQKDLGDRLLPCFSTPSHVPFSDVNLATGKAHAPKWGPDSSTSEVSTIQLEFRDLSRVTGDDKYEVCDILDCCLCNLKQKGHYGKNLQ